MSESRATGWPSGSPTAAQLKEFFSQIESGKISKERFQVFLRPPANDPFQTMRHAGIEGLGFGVRTYNCLKRIGIETVGDLTDKSENELKAIPNFGMKNMEEVKEGLSEHGLALKAEKPRSQTTDETEWPESELRPYVSLAYFDAGVRQFARVVRILNGKIEMLKDRSYPLSNEARAEWESDYEALNSGLKTFNDWIADEFGEGSGSPHTLSERTSGK